MKVTITLELDLRTPEGLKVYNAISESQVAAMQTPEPMTPKKARKKVQDDVAHTETADTPEEAQKDAPATSVTQQAPVQVAAISEMGNVDAEPTHSISQVRALLGTKVDDHRAAIKAKLSELGAPSVTLLQPCRYDEMYAFLETLE